MNILSIIEKKKNNESLSKEEINFFIEKTVNHAIKEAQIAAWLMAVTLNGMNDNETYWLTDAMLRSGKIYNFSNKHDVVIDKHSSGGVGDKVTLIIVPLCISLGIKIAKMSGRGLGHTGGTIDKLESINFKTDLSYKQSLHLLKTIGGFVSQQTNDIVPADKILYAIRNDTNTVQSIPLIAASIVSKKLALKKDFTFLDVKVGNGAFMKTIEEAEQLSKTMFNIFKKFKEKVIIHITDMSQPIGQAVGNAIEVKETVAFLRGERTDPFLKSLIYTFMSDILVATKKAKSKNEAIKKINAVINSHAAFDAFIKWTKAQSGKSFNHNFFKPKYYCEIKANRNGYLNYESALTVAQVAFALGAGRIDKTVKIDLQAGVWLNKVKNDIVRQGNAIATLYSSRPIPKSVIKTFESNVKISPKQFKINPLVLKVIK